ncbi:MAG: hypothetical protein AAGI38_01950 [Bacteroidota bacterium]
MKYLFASVSLVILFWVAGCGGNNDTSSSSGVSTTPQTPEQAVPAQTNPRDSILDILHAYYESLEAEQIDETHFFASTVEKFYGQENQSREVIGDIIRKGFDQVEGREVALDEQTLVVSLGAGGEMVAEFGGDVKLTRSADNSMVEERFQNRVTFSPKYKILKYETLEALTPKAAQRSANAPGIEASGEAYQQAEALMDILSSGDFSSANVMVHPDKGFYYLYRPGAYDVLRACKNFKEIFEVSDWLESQFKTNTCKLEAGAIPDFDCESFSKEGCFLSDVNNYSRASDIMKGTNEAELTTYDAGDIEEVKNLEATIKVQVLDTDLRIALYFGQIDGEWYLLVMDTASYDCSA